MEMMGPQVSFCSGNIYITLSFQIKKNQIPKILPTSVFVPLKCRQNVEICCCMDFDASYNLNEMPHMHDFCTNNNVQ